MSQSSRFGQAFATFRSKLLPWWLYAFLAAFLLVGAAAVATDGSDSTPPALVPFMLVLAALSVLFAVLGRQTQNARRQVD